MAKSDYVFESGEAIDVGSHGDHDYVFSSGEPVADTGKSTYVFESGTGLGGALWELATEGLDASLDTSINGVEARLSYENGSVGESAYIYRQGGADIGNGIDITFRGVESEKGASDDNKRVGITPTPGDNNIAAAVFSVEERLTGESSVACAVPGQNDLDAQQASVYPYPGPTDLRITYDGSTWEFYVDGSSVVQVSQSGDSGTFYPFLQIEGELGSDWLQTAEVVIQ